MGRGEADRRQGKEERAADQTESEAGPNHAERLKESVGKDRAKKKERIRETLTKTSEAEKKRDKKDSMSCPTRAEYIFHISKG